MKTFLWTSASVRGSRTCCAISADRVYRLPRVARKRMRSNFTSCERSITPVMYPRRGWSSCVERERAASTGGSGAKASSSCCPSSAIAARSSAELDGWSTSSCDAVYDAFASEKMSSHFWSTCESSTSWL